MANRKVYHGISLEKTILEEARRYAREEGFASIAEFIRWLIKTYPFIKALKQACLLDESTTLQDMRGAKIKEVAETLYSSKNNG